MYTSGLQLFICRVQERCNLIKPEVATQYRYSSDGRMIMSIPEKYYGKNPRHLYSDANTPPIVLRPDWKAHIQGSFQPCTSSTSDHAMILSITGDQRRYQRRLLVQIIDTEPELNTAVNERDGALITPELARSLYGAGVIEYKEQKKLSGQEQYARVLL